MKGTAVPDWSELNGCTLVLSLVAVGTWQVRGEMNPDLLSASNFYLIWFITSWATLGLSTTLFYLFLPG